LKAHPGNVGISTRVSLRAQLFAADTNKGITMKRIRLGPLAGAALCFSAFTSSSAAAQSDEQWSTLHSNLASMKTGVGVRAEQEPLWNTFQSAVENVFQSHTMARQKPMSAAGRETQAIVERRMISDAARPLYDSLDDTQKRNFESLGRSAQSKGPSVSWVCYGGSAGCDFAPAGWDGANIP
jgi:hypothetical protein